MPGIAHAAIVLAMILEKRDLRGYGDTVITLLAMHDDMLVAEILERLIRELRLLSLDFLQA
jgi:hypothetical protein